MIFFVVVLNDVQMYTLSKYYTTPLTNLTKNKLKRPDNLRSQGETKRKNGAKIG